MAKCTPLGSNVSYLVAPGRGVGEMDTCELRGSLPLIYPGHKS